jgi:hypothetical protein
MCQIKSERATGEHHPPQLVMLWKSTQHITRKMGLRYISCGGKHHPPQLVMWWKSTQHITRKMGGYVTSPMFW